MRLRAAVAGDVPVLADILGGWVAATPYLPRLHTAKADRWFVGELIQNADVLVADDNGPKGFIAREGEMIAQFFLAETARGQGIGGQLLDAMKARSPALHLWCFQENTGARRFYERHGFVAARFTDGAANEERVPDIRYEWRRG